MTDTSAGIRENPNGPLGVDEHLIGAVIRSPAMTVLDIASFVDSRGDLDEPARAILDVAIGLAQAGIEPNRENVVGELRRSDLLDRRTACWLASAAGCDTQAEHIRRYAETVVAASLRRRVRNWSTALIEVVDSGTETELAVTTEVFASRIAEVFERLRSLRQGADD